MLLKLKAWWHRATTPEPLLADDIDIRPAVGEILREAERHGATRMSLIAQLGEVLDDLCIGEMRESWEEPR